MRIAAEAKRSVVINLRLMGRPSLKELGRIRRPLQKRNSRL
jgi:hypothetical protein